MNLLHIASERSVPAADDLIPVLVFVLVKACPSSLLSTIQYVNSFYGDRLVGEDQYWWTPVLFRRRVYQDHGLLSNGYGGGLGRAGEEVGGVMRRGAGWCEQSILQ